MEKKIKEAIDKVRPSLQADGGDIEFVAFDEKNGELEVRLSGACVGCPMSALTLQEGVLKAVQEDVPEVKKIINI